MNEKIELLKKKYREAPRNSGNAVDVITLIDFFLAIYSLKKNLPEVIKSELKLKVGPVMGEGNDVISAANFLKEDLCKGDKNTLISASGTAVLEATTVLMEYITDEEGLYRVYSGYEVDLDRILNSF